MNEIEKQISKRRKEALEKKFYIIGQELVKKHGKDDAYQDGDISIKRDHYSQEFTGGRDDIEIFFKETSVYLGRGNGFAGPTETGIERYVPGEWEDTLIEIAEKNLGNQYTPVAKVKQKEADDLLKNWGIKLEG